MQIEESGEWRGVHIKKEGSCTDSNDTELNNGGGREGHIIVGLRRNLRERGRMRVK
jgi:Cu/Zn superoxide dismutase